MENIGLVVAAVALVAVGLVMMWSQKQAARATTQRLALEEELAKARARAKALEKKTHDASRRVTVLQEELNEAVARRDQKAIAAVLWDLELERSYRQWRDVIVPSDESRDQGGVNSGQQLAFAISQEVERLREEVGVAIRFDGGLDLPVEPEAALGALRISEELLALAAKESDEVVVSLDQSDEPAIVVALDCQGWGAADVVDLSRLEAELGDMAARLDGALSWEHQDDRVKATLRLPAPVPAA